MLAKMANSQQNVFESKEGPAMDGLTFRSGLVQGGKKNLITGAARRERNSVSIRRFGVSVRTY
jgi:hypothetical protein